MSPNEATMVLETFLPSHLNMCAVWIAKCCQGYTMSWSNGHSSVWMCCWFSVSLCIMVLHTKSIMYPVDWFILGVCW